MKTKLVMERPATKWQDAVPVGNGKIGAMMYGNIASEYILFNHENLWLPVFEKIENYDFSPYLEKYRRLLEQGRCHEAAEYWNKSIKEAGWPDFTYGNPNHPAFDLEIKQPLKGVFSHYARSLDMATGEAKTKWSSCGIDFERKMFVSRKDDVFVMEISSTGAYALDLELALKKHPFAPGDYPAKLKEDEIPLTTEVITENGDILFIGRHPDGKCYFGTMHIVTTGGIVTQKENGFNIEKADKVIVFVKLDTTENPEKDRHSFESLDEYNKLFEGHALLHKELFKRVSFTLFDDADDTNEGLLRKAYQTEAPLILYEKLFYFGRYLMISSASVWGGLPPNLQGIWNGEYLPAWNSSYTLDENIQAMYWQVLPGNLPEMTESYFGLIENHLEEWRQNAKRFYGCRGLLAPLSIGNHSSIAENMPYLLVTCVAGWLVRYYYEYYLYTLDEKFLLERALPIMEEVALFYEDFIYLDKNGKAVICPSMSPENNPIVHEEGYEPDPWLRASVSPTIDFAILKELLTTLISVYDKFGIENENKQRYIDLLGKIPEYRINSDGALAEWIDPQYGDNYSHRHFSHMYPLFPGNEITSDDTKLIEACRRTMELKTVRATSMTCWGFIHSAMLYIRLFETDKVEEMLEYIVKGCVLDNFFTTIWDGRGMGVAECFASGTPYRSAIPQLESNMGMTAVITDLIVRSTEHDEIFVLSALPDRWRKGELNGIKCMGKTDISVKWNKDINNISVKISGKGIKHIIFPEWINHIEVVVNGEKTIVNSNNIDIELDKGKKIVIDCFGRI